MTTADKIKICFVCFIFICFGSAMFLWGKNPQSIEIKHSDYRTDVIISKKRIDFFSAKDASEVITNVKRADVVSFKDRADRHGQSRDIYGVTLRTHDGRSVNIFTFDSFRAPKEKLRDEINNAIYSKTDYKYTDDENCGQAVTFGLFFMIIPLLIMLLAIFNGFKEITIDFRKTSNAKQENSDDDKYNNTIIK